MKTKQSLKYRSLALVTGLAVFAALWALPGTANGQVVGGDLFSTVNLGGTYNNGASVLYQYTPQYVPPNGTPNIFASALDTPRGLAFDGAGNLFVATTSSRDNSGDPATTQGTILKITPDGLMSTFGTAFPVSFLQGLATDSAGNVFVVAQAPFDPNNPNANPPSTIYKITRDGTLSPFGFNETIQGSTPGTAWGLACDSDGNVYVATSDSSSSTANGEILRFAPDGTQDSSPFVGPANFPSTGPGPLGLAFDAAGNLFVSTQNGVDSTGDIRKFGPDGMEITPRFATGLTKSPRALAFDSAGNLFVSEIGIAGTSITGDILQFTPDGTQTVFASTNFGRRGNHGPEWLAFTTGAVTPPTTAVTLSLPGATAPLTATVTSIDQNSLPPPPSNFVKLSGSNVAFDISTTVTPTPPIIIAFTVSPSLDVATLKALHYQFDPLCGCNDWQDVTIYPPNPAPNTVYGSVNSLSPFLLAIAKEGCHSATSISSNFNGTAISAGNYIWFNGVLKASGLGSTPVTIRFTGQTITSANFTLSVPDASVTFDPAATSATTTFNGSMWVTRVPSQGLAGNAFLSGVGYPVPVNLPGGIKNVTWSGTVAIDTSGVSVNWKWAAAVYKSFSSDYTALGVKPVDDSKASEYKNSDHAGTPENFKPYVTGGATGGGGSNYTGGYSATAAVGPCP